MPMNYSYCLPVIQSKKSDVQKQIKKSADEYRYFEIWLDYIEDLDETFVMDLIKELNEKLIVLFRRQNLEKTTMSALKRNKYLALFSNTQAFVDLDVFDQKTELLFCDTNKLTIKKIISYHNYAITPDTNRMHEILHEMDGYSPHIYKIATMINSDEDALRLLQLLQFIKQKDKKYIILGMGKKGQFTRIVGSLLGNEMIFAPSNANGITAPGQLLKDQFETIFMALDH
jgi:3-dehydroquinate dehydratase I